MDEKVFCKQCGNETDMGWAHLQKDFYCSSECAAESLGTEEFEELRAKFMELGNSYNDFFYFVQDDGPDYGNTGFIFELPVKVAIYGLGDHEEEAAYQIMEKMEQFIMNQFNGPSQEDRPNVLLDIEISPYDFEYFTDDEVSATVEVEDE